MTEIDLAAINKHHVPGTAYHWKHGYIPLDARTATLWGKKAHAESLIRQGRIHTPEPESWHSLFGKHKAEESPSASKTNTAVRELPFLGAVNHAIERKKAMSAAPHDNPAHRAAAKNYIESIRKLRVEQNKRFPHTSEAKTTAAEIAVTRDLHAAIAAGVPGLNHPDVSEPHTQGTKDGPVTTYGMADFSAMMKWKAAHERNVAAIREHFNGPERTSRGSSNTPKDLVALRAHLNKKTGAVEGIKAPPKPRAEKVNPRTMMERVFHPVNGDTIATTDRVGNPNQRFIYRDSKMGWQRQTRLDENSSWANRADIVHPLALQVMAQGDLGVGSNTIAGLDPAAAKSYAGSPERLARVNADTLAHGQSAFGTDTIGGFKAVSAQDALRGSPEAAKLHQHGSYYLKHSTHGTVIHVNDGVPVSHENLHRLAVNVETATNMTKPMMGDRPVSYHIDSMYGVSEVKLGRGVVTTWAKSNAAAYVGGGDKQHIHLSPDTTVNGPYDPVGARDHHGMHFAHQAPNSQVGTIVHELGHIHHNRTGNYSNDQNGDGRKFTEAQLQYVARQYGPETIRPELSQFHHTAYQPVRDLRRGTGRRAIYGELNNREGYAEAFAQHVLNQTNPGPQKPLSMPQKTADELHATHTAIAESYAKKFGWPVWVAGAGKGVKTA